MLCRGSGAGGGNGWLVGDCDGGGGRRAAQTVARRLLYGRVIAPGCGKLVGGGGSAVVGLGVGCWVVSEQDTEFRRRGVWIDRIGVLRDQSEQGKRLPRTRGKRQSWRIQRKERGPMLKVVGEPTSNGEDDADGLDGVGDPLMCA
jgi:hypothetical protein